MPSASAQRREFLSRLKRLVVEDDGRGIELCTHRTAPAHRARSARTPAPLFLPLSWLSSLQSTRGPQSAATSRLTSQPCAPPPPPPPLVWAGDASVRPAAVAIYELVAQHDPTADADAHTRHLDLVDLNRARRPMHARAHTHTAAATCIGSHPHLPSHPTLRHRLLRARLARPNRRRLAHGPSRRRALVHFRASGGGCLAQSASSGSAECGGHQSTEWRRRRATASAGGRMQAVRQSGLLGCTRAGGRALSASHPASADATSASVAPAAAVAAREPREHAP